MTRSGQGAKRFAQLYRVASRRTRARRLASSTPLVNDAVV
jgi:hypothetical protein